MRSFKEDTCPVLSVIDVLYRNNKLSIKNEICPLNCQQTQQHSNNQQQVKQPFRCFEYRAVVLDKEGPWEVGVKGRKEKGGKRGSETVRWTKGVAPCR